MYPSNIKSTLVQATLALEPTTTGVFSKTLSATITEVPTATLEARQDWRENRDRAKQKGKDAAARGRDHGREGAERGKEGSRRGEKARQRGVDKADAAARENARLRHRAVRFAENDEIIPECPGDEPKLVKSRAWKADRKIRFAEEAGIIQ
ncbi:hypothetical protein N0V88_004647 [Collariella sp. IMI 366227]|nr:hypothetical protein N0V88_004647 [Collariella sp. IMI 366227]